MSYWGFKGEDSDYAFGAIGAYIYLIKERMFADLQNVIQKKYPEQAVVASIACLRAVGERFPNNLGVHFDKTDFARAKKGFEDWYAVTQAKLPEEYAERLLDQANREFSLFEESIFGEKKDSGTV